MAVYETGDGDVRRVPEKPSEPERCATCGLSRAARIHRDTIHPEGHAFAAREGETQLIADIVEIATRSSASELRKAFMAGGPFDGESHTFGDPASAADYLERVKAAGYNVPQYAIDCLREEAETETEAP
jgi:hypothetical protein